MYYFDNNAPKKTHDNQLNKSAFDSWTNKKTLIDTMNRLVIEHPRLHNEQIGFADKLDIKEKHGRHRGPKGLRAKLWERLT